MRCIVTRQKSVGKEVYHMFIEGTEIEGARYMLTAHRQPSTRGVKFMLASARNIHNKLHSGYLGKIRLACTQALH
jgi:hypothetical protein